MRSIQHVGNICNNGRTNFDGHFTAKECFIVFRDLKDEGADPKVSEYGCTRTLVSETNEEVLRKWAGFEGERLLSFNILFSHRDLFFKIIKDYVFRSQDYIIEPWRRHGCGV